MTSNIAAFLVIIIVITTIIAIKITYKSSYFQPSSQQTYLTVDYCAPYTHIKEERFCFWLTYLNLNLTLYTAQHRICVPETPFLHPFMFCLFSPALVISTW